MDARRALRAFAFDLIPLLLFAAGGRLDKEEMQAEVRRRFTQLFGWPEEFDRVQRGGVTVGRNAIAWALHDLVRRDILLRSAGRKIVELARPGMPRVEPASARVESAAVRTEARIEPGCASMTLEARIRERAAQRARDCRARARKEGVRFDEAFVRSAGDDVERQGYRCAVTRIAFDLDTIGDGAGGSHYAPSPDRIVPALGYVPGNVRWVLWMVNRGKSRMTEDQFRAMCKAVAAAPT